MALRGSCDWDESPNHSFFPTPGNLPSSMPVRVRYAPSPTGSPHVGNVRDALFKYLLARNTGGTLILRIEDTDRSRYIPGCEEEIVDSLKWVGIDWDEGPDVGGPNAPYRQSERAATGIYEHWIRVLLEAGHAYRAFETPEELAEMRSFQEANKLPVGYFGGEWRDATPGKVEAALLAGKPFVIRQRIPRNTIIAIEDFIRGRIEWDSNTVDDPVLIKADGMPTYHFAAMVDDHLMGITHIMRGEEWISSAPKHAVLFDQFGWERPIFVHCPVIKGKDGAKLSKRHGDTRCLDFRSAGYLPEALANFIALIGWSPGGDVEIMSMSEMIEAFSLEGLQPSPGVFDLDKLRWMNGVAIRSLPQGKLADLAINYARDPATYEYWSRHEAEPHVRHALDALRETADHHHGHVVQALALMQERAQTLAELATASEFFFVDEPTMEPAAVAKWFTLPHLEELFHYLLDEIAKASPDGKTPIEVSRCEAMIRTYAANKGWDKLGPVVHPVRVALTGKTAGPGLFELMSVLGPERMTRRLRRALETVRKSAPEAEADARE